MGIHLKEWAICPYEGKASGASQTAVGCIYIYIYGFCRLVLVHVYTCTHRSGQNIFQVIGLTVACTDYRFSGYKLVSYVSFLRLLSTLPSYPYLDRYLSWRVLRTAHLRAFPLLEGCPHNRVLLGASTSGLLHPR